MLDPELIPPTQEAVDRQAETRLLSSAELIKDGAVIIRGVIVPTAEQVEELRKEDPAEAVAAAKEPETSVQAEVSSAPPPEPERPAQPILSAEQALERRLNVEKEWRRNLVDICVRKAKGTVSAYTIMPTMTPEQVRDFKLGLEQTQRKSLVPMYNGGYQEIGEVESRSTYKRTPGSSERTKNDFAFDADDNAEEVYFPTPAEGQDTDTVIYKIANDEWHDATGRRGNNLTVGFEIPPGLGKTLRAEIAKDPQIIRDLVEKQLKSLGVPESVWKSIRPPYEGIAANARAKGEQPLPLVVIQDMEDGARAPDGSKFYREQVAFK